MRTRKITIVAVLALAVSGGAALAQDQTASGFYADPVMADPPTVAVNVYPPREATSDIAAVSPASGAPARPQHAAACTAINPCAATTPAAHG